MNKEDYIELRKSIKKEIIFYVTQANEEAIERERFLLRDISHLYKKLNEYKSLLFGRLYTARDRENALIEEIDALVNINK